MPDLALKPIDYDPFKPAGGGPKPVDHDPFATGKGPTLKPVDYDPFAPVVPLGHPKPEPVYPLPAKKPPPTAPQKPLDKDPFVAARAGGQEALTQLKQDWASYRKPVPGTPGRTQQTPEEFAKTEAAERLPQDVWELAAHPVGEAAASLMHKVGLSPTLARDTSAIAGAVGQFAIPAGKLKPGEAPRPVEHDPFVEPRPAPAARKPSPAQRREAAMARRTDLEVPPTPGAAAKAPLPTLKPVDYDPFAKAPTLAAKRERGPTRIDPSLEKPRTTVGDAADKVRDGYKAMKTVFAASTIDEGRAAARIDRRTRGEHGLDVDRAVNDMNKHVNEVGRLPVEQQRRIGDYLEGKTDALDAATAGVKKGAETMRRVYGEYRDRIQKILGDKDVDGKGPSFVSEYFPHLWKEAPDKVSQRMGQFFAKQGSGKNLKARSIPTIADGIAAGLTPVFENPLEATSHYVMNMSNYLRTHETQNLMKEEGIAKWHPVGAAPEGWVKLDGINTERARAYASEATEPGPVPVKREALYAPEAAARIYNRSISKGLDAGKVTGPLYRGYRKFSNTITGMKLGLSGYHALNMVQQGIMWEMNRGLVAATKGRLKTAGKAYGGAPLGFVSLAVKGSRMERRLLEGVPNAVDKAYIRAGNKIGMDPIYRASGTGSFYKAWRNGTLENELRKAAHGVSSGTFGERVSSGLSTAAKAASSLMGPLFEDYIPALKRGAFATRMADWLAEHPEATEAEQADFAAHVSDMVDDRFGEMVQDNLFWNKQAKQIAQVAFLSPSWVLGDVRNLIGGVVEIPKSAKGLVKGEGITDRTAQLITMAVTVGLTNAVYQYLKTGETPQDAKDLVAPRTGGTTTMGRGDNQTEVPERALFPGEQKDVFEAADAVSQGTPGVGRFIGNKGSPGLKMLSDWFNNKDYRGLDIYPEAGSGEPDDLPAPWKPLVDSAIDSAMPIGPQSLSRRQPSSNISTPETLMGVKPVPSFMSAPEWTAANRQRWRETNWKRKLDADAAAKEKTGQ